jgi:hypothetical protein
LAANPAPAQPTAPEAEARMQVHDRDWLGRRVLICNLFDFIPVRGSRNKWPTLLHCSQPGQVGKQDSSKKTKENPKEKPRISESGIYGNDTKIADNKQISQFVCSYKMKELVTALLTHIEQIPRSPLVGYFEHKGNRICFNSAIYAA